MVKIMRTLAILVSLALSIALPAQAQSQTRLLVIGDSLSRCLYASSEANGFCFVVADALDAAVGRMPGATLEEAEQYWPTWEWQADIILVEFGTNDIRNLDAIPEAEWPARYGAFLDAVQATGARVVVSNSPWLGRWPEHPEYDIVQRFNAYIAAEAAARDISVADLWAATYGHTEYLSQPGEPSPFPPGFEGDGFHPNDAGHRAIADEFLRVLGPHQYWFPLFWRTR